MSRLRFQISVSLDGFAAGPNQSEEHPLGEGGEDLHEWVFELEAWRRPHGREGGVRNASSAAFEAAVDNVGATIMGRGMFGGGPGDWPEDPPWQGWWGDEPPFHTPVFVLTHHERAPLTLSDTTFTFVTDGIEAALEQAHAAAGGGDVTIGGGAKTIQQYLAAGLVDEFLLNVPPVILGDGERLLENLGDPPPRFEQVDAVAGPKAAHLTYRRAG